MLASVPSNATAGAIVGTAKTVVRTVEGISDVQVRTLIFNDNVHQSEKIRTKNLSATRIQFSDNSDFLVGPNSEVILDKFVYDPDAAKDNLSLRISWGLMKFKTGVMPSSSYKIQSRAATIGVRGTEFSVKVLGDGTTIVYVISGVVVVTDNKGISIEVRQYQSAIVYPEGFPQGEGGPVVFQTAPPNIIDEVRSLIALIAFNEKAGIEQGALQFRVPDPVYRGGGHPDDLPELALGWYAPGGDQGQNAYVGFIGYVSGDGGGGGPDRIIYGLRNLGAFEENAPFRGAPVLDGNADFDSGQNPDVGTSEDSGSSGGSGAGPGVFTPFGTSFGDFGSSGGSGVGVGGPGSAPDGAILPSFDGYLVNGDFEAGKLNWAAGGLGHFAIEGAAPGGAAANHHAVLTTGSPVSISAHLTTTPDTVYTIKWNAVFLDGAGILDVFLDGTPIATFDALEAGVQSLLQVTLYQAKFGNLTDAELTFLFNGPTGGLRLVIDDVMVIASDLPLLVDSVAPAPTATPVPSPLGLILVAGILGLCRTYRGMKG